MATLLEPKQFAEMLRCLCAQRGELVCDDAGATCSECGKTYPVTDGVLEMVDMSLLEPETARELEGNRLELSDEAIQHIVNKEEWSDYRNHLANIKVKRLSRHLRSIGSDKLISLGSGAGSELKSLLAAGVGLKSIYCSDLVWSRLCVTPVALAAFDVELGRFSSDLDRCPVAAEDIPILVYEALHHTPDMHATIEGLMARGYRDLLFIEPTNNAVIRWFAERGMAQRIEYSGVKPGRLELSRLRELGRRYGYTSSIATTWEIPRDYSRLFSRGSPVLERLFLFCVDAFSAVTRLVRFGNMSIIRLQKTGG